jgi:pimeloyl-ACP methyl ester carboxylesterase
MKRLLPAAALLAAACAGAQELVTLQPRPGVSESFFIAAMGAHAPQAVALLLSGGGGNIRLRREDGQIRFGAQNFLPRSRAEFIRNGIVPFIVDNPSDQQSAGMSDEFRSSRQHAEDLRAIVREAKRRYPGLPVFLVGTSRSTLSAAYVAAALGDELAGVVLTSSLFYEGNSRQARGALVGFGWSRIKVPVLFVHHRDDGCRATPYREAAALAGRFPLISVSGGKPPESGPCDPLAAHGYFGKEAETVDAIAGWMLKRPFARDIP